MTTLQDALEKIRNQIRIAEKYISDNPDWVTAKEVLRSLQKREHELNNQIQVEYFREHHRWVKGGLK
jgi:hypothetical protein